MKEKTVRKLGKTSVVSMAVMFAMIYFWPIINGKFDVLVRLNYYGEMALELPLLLALLPFGLIHIYYMLKDG